MTDTAKPLYPRELDDGSCPGKNNMIDRCVARTFDGYEYDECGKPANFAGLCSEHFKRRLEDVEQNLKEAEEKTERLRSELARLRTWTTTAEQLLKGT